jgi:hypothetical protein
MAGVAAVVVTGHESAAVGIAESQRWSTLRMLGTT